MLLGDPESPSYDSGSQDDNVLYLLEKCHPEEPVGRAQDLRMTNIR